MPAILLRLPVYLLAAFMAFMGVQKFTGDVPIFQIMETNVAASAGLTLGFIEPYGRYLTGVLELAAAVLLLARRQWGAWLSVAIIAGAIGAHLTFLGISTPMSGEPGAEKSPVLFIMALGSFALAWLVVWLGRRPAQQAG